MTYHINVHFTLISTPQSQSKGGDSQKSTSTREALRQWEENTGEKASEATEVKLIGLQPPMEKLDASLQNLTACEWVHTVGGNWVRMNADEVRFEGMIRFTITSHYIPIKTNQVVDSRENSPDRHFFSSSSFLTSLTHVNSHNQENKNKTGVLSSGNSPSLLTWSRSSIILTTYAVFAFWASGGTTSRVWPAWYVCVCVFELVYVLPKFALIYNTKQLHLWITKHKHILLLPSFCRSGGVGRDAGAALDLLQPHRKAEGDRRVKEIEGNTV